VLQKCCGNAFMSAMTGCIAAFEIVTKGRFGPEAAIDFVQFYSPTSAFNCVSANVSWLFDNTCILVDGRTVERLLGVELGYVDWRIGEDGVFESGERTVC
jgi:hypothetical protein